mmetsp:Transcript_4131/g.11539  ORF Transcript_4131/g.11539 Transcript_4131/m.11539 type:complete len:571 (-) Transcript_4131:436-2148(-)
MLQGKAAELASRWEEGRFYITYFLARTGGKKRIVFNLPPLNDFVQDAPAFRTESMKSLTESILPGDFGVKVDLKKAFWGIRIPPRLRKYFCFIWGGRTYQLTSLPLGLKVSPFIFQSVMKAAVATLRRRGIRVLVYVDDLLILHQSRSQARRHAQAVVDYLDSLGFVVSPEKTMRVPEQAFTYLGLTYNTADMTVAAPPEKLRDIRRQARGLLQQDNWTPRQVARLTGKIVFIAPAAMEARLHLQELFSFQRLALKKGSWDTPQEPSDRALQTVRWWARSPPLTPTTFAPVNVGEVVEASADAGPRGLGAIMQDGPTRLTAARMWRAGQARESTNARELRALLFALQTWHQRWKGRTVRLTTDSQVAYRYVRKVTGRVDHLSSLARRLNALAIKHKIRLLPRQVPGEQIPEADALSRLSDTDDYRLSREAWNRVTFVLGTPRVDLFASRFTNKCSRFFTRQSDPMAAGRNAFEVDWREEGLAYAFPPPKLLPKTIRKIVADRARAIVVMPSHWGNPWIPMIRDLHRWNLKVSGVVHLPPASVVDTLPRRETFWHWQALLLDAREAPPWSS